MIDKATGAVTGLGNGVASILDGIAKPVEAFAEGLANMFGGATPAPPIHRRERGPTPDQIREAERALTNINQSLKRGDEYLMKMCQNWEIQQRERPTHDQGPSPPALAAFKEAARSLTRRLSRLFRRHKPAKRQPRPLPS